MARHVGVSEATVSRVLNGRPGISESTRAGGEAPAEELVFGPDLVLRGSTGAAKS